jgi:hypothetical protein
MKKHCPFKKAKNTPKNREQELYQRIQKVEKLPKPLTLKEKQRF